MQGLVETLNTNARALRRTGLGGFVATAPASPTTSRSLVSATASLSAAQGTSRVEVLQLAQTEKIGGDTVSDTTAARGLVGSMSINGTAINIVGTDTLADIRTKINSAGAGVTAAIVSDGGTAGSLVLTSSTGADRACVRRVGRHSNRQLRPGSPAGREVRRRSSISW
jgi:flagellar hook-associated protein 2